jgi:hypothetical protein
MDRVERYRAVRGPFSIGAAAVLAILAAAACSSQDDVDRHRGDDGGLSRAGAGGAETDAGRTTGAGGRGDGEASGGAPSPSAGRGPASDASIGAGGEPSADAGAEDAGAFAVPRERLQTELVHALCDNVKSCCTAVGRAFDVPGCFRQINQHYVVPLSSSMTAYDPVEAGRCVRAVSLAAEACAAVDATTCFDAFVGTVAAGGACQSSFDCAPGPGGYAVCPQDGHCVQVARGVLGAGCAFTCIDREGGSPACKNSYGVSNTVAVACHSNDGLVCITAANGTATCRPSSTDCKQNPTVSCAAGQTCDLVTGTCYTPAKLGASCAATPCDRAAYCSGGVCVAVEPVGAACASDAECASAKCESGSCVAYSPAAASWCGPLVSP